MPGLKLLELIAEIVLEAMRGQTPEQKKQMWDWYIEDVRFIRKLLKMGDERDA